MNDVLQATAKRAGRPCSRTGASPASSSVAIVTSPILPQRHVAGLALGRAITLPAAPFSHSLAAAVVATDRWLVKKSAARGALLNHVRDESKYIAPSISSFWPRPADHADPERHLSSTSGLN